MRRRVTRQRLLALVLAAATLAAVVVLSANPPPPPTLLQARATGPSHLADGSPGALPRNILVADRGDDRLEVISPRGQLAWTRAILGPSDVYLSPSRTAIVVTQRAAFVILRIDVATGDITYYYGKSGRPGAAPNRLRDPQTGHELRSGMLVLADEANCRILYLASPSKRPRRVLGETGVCKHDPPVSFGYPDAVFPTPGGGLVVTEQTPGWIDRFDSGGKLIGALRVRLSDPLDANEYAPGKLIVTGRSYPGVVEELTTKGRVLWRYAPTSGPGVLDRPRLAQVLPNGDVLVCDSDNDRIVVISRTSKTIVWQYGHTGQPGSRPGYLEFPESASLLPQSAGRP